MANKTWCGPVPATCDICGLPIKNVFIDGATCFGVWANMCPSCHTLDGRGLGIGRGQKYELAADGMWHKEVYIYDEERPVTLRRLVARLAKQYSEAENQELQNWYFNGFLCADLLECSK